MHALLLLALRVLALPLSRASFLHILRDMPQYSSVKNSSNNSDYSASDTDHSVELDTDLTDIDEFADKNEKNEAWVFPNDDHPPEYYLQQLENFNEQEYIKEDYKESSTRLLNRMEDQWNQ